ncbi:MAG: DUF4465 domain-containing protein [Fluviicola sp.]
MKKIYIVVSLALSSTAFGQQIATFEDLGLPANSHWDGSDSTGGFTSGSVYFMNEYNHDWSYWSGGFIYSSSQNDTTAGYTNDFSAITAGGQNSPTYAVNYGGNIDFGSLKTISSIAVTNTTYAYLSMRDGDFFGKQFGSPLNAAGQADGTNGEDWFKLTIYGFDGDSIATGSIDFYLADFRFADSAQDYLIDSWQTVDLTSLGAIRYLNFELSSSDNSGGYMNTPAYFALDNLSYGNLAIEEAPTSDISYFPNPALNQVQFTNEGPASLSITDMNGRVVFVSQVAANAVIDLSDLQPGTYSYRLTSEGNLYQGNLIKL